MVSGHKCIILSIYYSTLAQLWLHSYSMILALYCEAFAMKIETLESFLGCKSASTLYLHNRFSIQAKLCCRPILIQNFEPFPYKSQVSRKKQCILGHSIIPPRFQFLPRNKINNQAESNLSGAAGLSGCLDFQLIFAGVQRGNTLVIQCLKITK